jgi:hypothetical protein
VTGPEDHVAWQLLISLSMTARDFLQHLLRIIEVIVIAVLVNYAMMSQRMLSICPISVPARWFTTHQKLITGTVSNVTVILKTSGLPGPLYLKTTNLLVPIQTTYFRIRFPTSEFIHNHPISLIVVGTVICLSFLVADHCLVPNSV